MVIKIQAAMRLAIANWFEELTPEEQKRYVEQHPDSKYAEDYDTEKEKEFNPKEGDDARVDELRHQIADLKNDIAEIEADGEDASYERGKLAERREELRTLRASVMVAAAYPKNITWRKALLMIQVMFPLPRDVNIRSVVPGRENMFYLPHTMSHARIMDTIKFVTGKHGEPKMHKNDKGGTEYTWMKPESNYEVTLDMRPSGVNIIRVDPIGIVHDSPDA